MNAVVGIPAETRLCTDDVYTWQFTPTPLGEHYELVWPTALCGDCRGVVQQTGPYYDAYIEMHTDTGSAIRWAQMQFQTSADARAWVQNHMER
jgi:hypothetical protein